jgi:asparagine synthase (glutamine-hydrolysing)
MCGIAGFTWNDKKLLKQMCDTISHRGPDQFGYFETKGISLGHRRLSIIDLSIKGKQPMFNEDGTIVLIFNGEIYNYKTLRAELEKCGHTFSSDTDSEVIIHAYEEYGEDCVSLLNGMFAFAIWDDNSKKLFLARDRVGIKPLYYSFFDGELIFASEIKALLKFEGLRKEIDSTSLVQFLNRKVVFGSGTFVRGIEKLLPGETLTFEKGLIRKRQYYDFAFHSSSKELDFEKTFETVVEDMMVSDVPLGVFLSGGIDSSLITAFMAKRQTEVNTFTVGFGLQTDEFRYAKKVAEMYSTNHHELHIELSDMTKALNNIIWHMDEPIADPAIVPTYIMSEFARKKVTVSLVGEGADELFAGYSKYNRTRYMPKQLYYALTDVAFNQREVKKALKPEFYERKKASYLNPYYKINNGLSSAMAFDFKEIMPNFQLMKIDKMTMAHSLEARVPFLDNRILDIASRMKNNQKLKNKRGKFFMREISRKILPQSFSNDKKRSFYTPLKDWFNKELIEIATVELDDSKIFSKTYLNNIFKLQKNSYRRYKYSNQLWMLYLVEKWKKIIYNE